MATQGNMTVEWFDSGREPRVAPNPNYPDGIDIVATTGDVPTCYTKLPYPAKRIGNYEIKCLICGLTVRVTTAGRPDDPRSLTIACRRMAQA
jgi:hypothetical protein